MSLRRDGRAVECTGLENRQGLIPFQGSNPCPSTTCHLHVNCYSIFIKKSLTKFEQKMKLKIFLKIILIHISLLFLVYTLHVKFFEVDVVFYSAILDAFIASLFVQILIFINLIKNPFNSFEKFQIFIITALIGYSFAISVPTVIDRSLSFYILEKIHQRGGGILHKDFESIFVNEYTKEHMLVDIRLTEQLESGTITITDGCVELTDKGDLIQRISSFFRSNFLPKRRLVMGDYTDKLTHPFDNINIQPEYACRSSS